MLAHRRMLELDDMLRLGSQPLDTPAELAPVETDGAPSQPPTVLVVDDDRAVREVLSAVLKEEGYRVRQAAGADAALEMLRGEDLPLVLCDMKMPEHDGLWLLDNVLQRHPHAAVVMLTGFGDTESAVECLRRGAADYLLKPPRVTELVRAIERAWSKSKLTSARARYHQGLARRGVSAQAARRGDSARRPHLRHRGHPGRHDQRPAVSQGRDLRAGAPGDRPMRQHAVRSPLRRGVRPHSGRRAGSSPAAGNGRSPPGERALAMGPMRLSLTDRAAKAVLVRAKDAEVQGWLLRIAVVGG